MLQHDRRQFGSESQLLPIVQPYMVHLLTPDPKLLEWCSVSGVRPTVSGERCAGGGVWFAGSVVRGAVCGLRGGVTLWNWDLGIGIWRTGGWKPPCRQRCQRYVLFSPSQPFPARKAALRPHLLLITAPEFLLLMSASWLVS